MKFRFKLRVKIRRSRQMYVTGYPDDQGRPGRHMAVRTRKWSWRQSLAFVTWERAEYPVGRRGGEMTWNRGLKRCGYLEEMGS